MQVLFVSVLLLAVSASFCSAQHWSYGLQPGGKREVENPVESFEEIAKELDRLGPLQYFRCNGPCQPALLRGSKGILANPIEGENGKQVLDLQKRKKEDRNGALANKSI